MTPQDITAIVASQRAYFKSGATLDVEGRLRALRILRAAIVTYEDVIASALQRDLGKSSTESIMCEIGMVKSALNHMLRHANHYAKAKRVRTPLAQFPATSLHKPSPFGVVLVMSPWNYPFLLTMEPLIEAIAAGNTVVVKPSAYSPHTSSVLEKLLTQYFDPRLIAVVTGGREENQQLLDEQFDHIFFTGSQRVGKEVMRKAAAHLTPVTLELGGKSPCIVERTADIPLAARRIVFGKYLNCGQTCIAPDYIYCDAAIADELMHALAQEIRIQFGEAPLANDNYGRIVSVKHFDRLTGLIDPAKIAYGGRTSPDTLQIEPTLLRDVEWGDAVMQEEIFGPILPVLTYENFGDAIDQLNDMPHPLALYIFTEDKIIARQVMSRLQFGGGCVNDTIIHLASNSLPFGGVGASGMGSYHGEAGFRTFSHEKSIVNKSTRFDLPLRYQPYGKWKERLIRLAMR